VTEEVRRVVKGVASRSPHAVLTVGLAVLGAVLGQVAIELGAGRVPVPAGYAWLIPIANAGLVVLVAHLPSPASRGRAASYGSLS